MTKPLLKKSADSRLTSRLGKDSYEEPSLLDGFPCIFYEADNSLRILRASPNVHELIGIERERIIGVSWLFDEGVVPADRGLLKQKFLESGQSGIASLIHRLIDDRGRIVRVAHSLQRINRHRQDLIRGNILPLIVSDGNGVVIDVGFVSKFLHKIGNHFQLLNLMLHSIRRSDSILKELELVQETTEEAIDLTHIFSEYLQQPMLSTYVDLFELLDSLLESRIVNSREKNLELIVSNDGPLRQATIQGDPGFLEMAIGAVLDNAIDASPIGGKVLVKISVPPEISGVEIPRTFNVAVSDNGSGVAADHIDHSVEPFHAKKPDGKGMGLDLASWYIEMHGGLVRVHKREGNGTVVDIALPAAIAPHPGVDERMGPSS